MEPVEEPGEAMPLFKKRSLKKSTIRKRPTTPAESTSGSEYSSADEDGRKVKRRRKAGGVVVTSTKTSRGDQDFSTSKFSADRSAQIEVNSDATKQSNWFDEGKDGFNEKLLLGTTRSMQSKDPGESNEGMYKGTTAYTSFIAKNPNAPARQIGPVKAPTNVRTITVTDYSPDVCKDYKQTGYCGFGDSCKYLHAREDYKQGWQLDKEWETVTKGKSLGGKVVSRRNKENNSDADSDGEEEALLEGIPFACILCKGPYKYPIATRCGHYFCEPCAIQRFKKTPNCAACGAGTGGVFNGAKNLKKLLDKKRDREAKLARESREDTEGEEDSSSDSNDEQP